MTDGSHWRALAISASLLAAGSSPAAADVYISEFMAGNSRTIADEDGDYSDWIEILNDSLSPVNLAGWHLTDDPQDKSKWTFPAVTLGPNRRLLIWASNKNERDPGQPLHTNFRLDVGGEYLGLVRPDGVTVEHEFAATPQFSDVSYGMSQTAGQQVLLDYGAPVRVKVPADASEDTTWFMPEFNDAAWAAKTSGIGFDTTATPPFKANDPGTGQPYINVGGDVQAEMFNVGTSIYMRWAFNVADPTMIESLTLRMRYDDGYLFYVNGAFKGHKSAWTAVQTPNPPRPFNAASVASRSNTAAVAYEDFPIAGGSDYLHPGVNTLAIHGLNVVVQNNDVLFSPQLVARLVGEINGNVVYFSVPTPGASNNAGTSNIGPAVTDVPETVPQPDVGGGPSSGVENLPLVASAATGFSGTQGQSGWNWGYMAGSGTYDWQTSFQNFPGGAGQGVWDGSTQWWTGSAWDHNTTGTAPWTFISASQLNPNDSTPGPREAPIARWTSTLSGAYTIHGNFTRPSAAGNGTTGRVFHNGTQLFSAVTRGNVQTFTLPVQLAVGDKIDFLIDVGPADDDGSDATNYVAEIREGHPPPPPPVNTINIPITARVSRTVNDVASVTLKYRIMFTAEVSLPMRDDGLSGDATANDGVFTAVITTNQLTPGQLLRWRVEAVDSLGNIGKQPPYLLPADDQQYFGTVALDPVTATSQIPLLHWFQGSGVNPDSDTPAPITIFYLGELYDNCHVTLHGQSTRGFAKKSYDLDGPADHRIKWTTDPEARRVKDINLLSPYADKSKMRNTVAYEAYADAGVKGHYAFPVRVHRNAVYYGLADFVEDGDDRYLERVGLDPNGALYKVYNTLDGSNITTTNSNGVEKKTRRSENTSDFQAMINGLVETRTLVQRRQFSYDNIDIPALVNYMAASISILNNDQGHKNYYMYRDTEGDREWTILPWDVDLSLGHTWTSAQNYFDDDIDSVAGFFLGANNRLKSLVTGGSSGSGSTPAPEIAQMFLRRLRTLDDRWIGLSATPGWLEQRMRVWLDILDPPGQGVQSDAYLDFKRWGFWVDGNAGPINYLDTRGPDHQLRPHVMRMINLNPNPPYPAANPSPSLGRNSIPPFLAGRRTTLYSPSLTLSGQPMPTPQPAVPPLTFGTVDFNPGATEREYFTLVNANAYAVDISGWTISGGVELTFPGGCVIPSGGGAVENRGRLFVVRDPAGFRARTVAPMAGQFCLCIGPYDGQLSARGETLELRDAAGALIASTSWTPAATPLQNSLRVTQILFEPNDPSPGELTLRPDVAAGSFEWLELMNTGGSPLDLGGARFTEGIEFVFPAGTNLAGGSRLILAADPAAFAMRWPGVGVPVVGPYAGQLSNSGETLHLVDPSGESILEFSYNDSWYPPADSRGHSLVMLDPLNTPFNEWGGRPRWGVSLNPGGGPGNPATPIGMVFEFWQNGRFTTAERGDPAISGLEADPDADGLNNFLEYSLAADPKALSLGRLPAVSSVAVGSESYLALTFRVQKNVLDLSYLVEATDNMQTWDAQSTPVGAAIDNGDGTETLTIRDSVPMTASALRFVHLRIIHTP